MKSNYLDNTRKQMRKGVLELCILSIISEEESYPPDIKKRLEAYDLVVVEGTLYPLLTRLKNSGLLDYSWRESKSGPPRKYYRITEQGEQFRIALMGTWHQLVQAVDFTSQNASNQ
jgi:PadR family transcriptional regulator PadR